MKTLTIGDIAPDFTVNDQDGHPVSLSGLRGKKVVLYFYPKDQTPGCTAEACNLRDNYHRFMKMGYEILGVSTDSEQSHRNFIAKQKLPFRLLADPEKKVHEKYGTWVEKSMYGRTYMGTRRITYVIDEKGIIEDIVEKVDTAHHTDQLLKTLSAVPAKRKAAAKKKTSAKKTAAKRKTAKKSASKKKAARKKK
jgi:thioredoxin-dependent peroxiredoxin